MRLGNRSQRYERTQFDRFAIFTHPTAIDSLKFGNIGTPGYSKPHAIFRR